MQYNIYHLTDQSELTIEVHDFIAALEEEVEYTVNGKDYGSHGAVEGYISSLKMDDSFTEDDACDSIRKCSEGFLDFKYDGSGCILNHRWVHSPPLGA